MIKRILSGVAAMAMVAGGLALFGVASVSAATSYTPTITVSPNTDLTNGEQVTITGSGFMPDESSLIAVECIATATTAAGCNTTTFAPVGIDSSGNLVSLTFDVATGPIGTGTCGTSAADAICAISVGSSATGEVAAFATIGFDTGPNVALSPSTGLTNGQSVTVSGLGYTPSSTVYAVECELYATSPADCDTAAATPISVSPTGALTPTPFKVVTGIVNGKCGTNAINYDGCIIEVANVAGTIVGFSTFDFVAPAVTAPPAPTATRVSGRAVPGKSVAAAIIGKNFTAVAKITGGPGATISVKSVSSGAIRVTIKEPATARKGAYAMIIHFKSGKSARVNYTVA